MIKIIKKINKGFSLVELLVSVSIFLIFITATTSILVSTTRQVNNSSNKEKAVALAHESMEAVRNIRDDNFNNLIDGIYSLSVVSNHWNLSNLSDITDIFNRQIVISTISSTQKKIVVNITWSDQISNSNSVVQESYLTAWNSPLNIGLTIDKTVINHGGTKVPSDFLPYNLSFMVWDNSIDPPVLSNFDIPIIWSPSTMPLGPNTYNFITSTDSNYTITVSSSCSGNSITFLDGDTKICSITYEETEVPTITTPTVTSLTPTTATLGANVISLGNPSIISARGTCLGITPAPITNCLDEGSTTTGIFTQNRTGLIPDTLYYYRGYAINVTGTAYSTDGSFTTNSNNIIPEVTTPTESSISSTSATLGASVISLGLPASISERGTCLGITPAPTTNCLAEGGTTIGVFTQNRTGLLPGTLYYYRGYAINGTGTAYSTDGSFTTLGGACSTTGILPTNYDNSGSTSAIVAKPTGVVQGDIMFAYIMHNNSTDRLTVIPAGWIQIGRHRNGSSNQALYYKLAGPIEGANYTFGLSSSSRFAVTINAYRGCFNTVTPIEISSNVEYVTNNTIYRAASIVLPSAFTTVIVFPSVNTSGLKTFSAPLTQGGGWTVDYANGNSSSQFSRNAFSKLINSSGATGVIDSIGFLTNTRKHSFAVGLKPL
jgi:prepilin-type N-terminal cleavage/methylation domain-containing protein